MHSCCSLIIKKIFSMQILNSRGHSIISSFALSAKYFHIGFFVSAVILKVAEGAASSGLALISKTSPFLDLYFIIFGPFEYCFIVCFVGRSCGFIIFKSFILLHADFQDSADAAKLTWLGIRAEVCLIASPSSLCSNFKL
jgi:hypothetical protein